MVAMVTKNVEIGSLGVSLRFGIHVNKKEGH